MQAREGGSPEAASAMEQLCRSYWYPLYAFARSKGHQHEDASDLTQSFFARVLEKDFLRSVDARLGKFRTFLLASMTHFMANEWSKSRRQRRGGGMRMLSLDDAEANRRYQLEPVDDASPDKIFDRKWAETMMKIVLDRLAAETDEERFKVLKEFLLGDKGTVSYREAGSRLGVTEAAVTSAIHRMRARFRVLLHAELANTVNGSEGVQEELQHLAAILEASA